MDMDTEEGGEWSPRGGGLPEAGGIALRISLRIFLGLFGLPFLFFGLIFSGGSLVAGFTGKSVGVSLFGLIFGLPFVAVGGAFVWIAIRGTDGVPGRIRGLASRRLERLQDIAERSAQQAGVDTSHMSGRRPGGGTPSTKSFGDCPRCGAGITDESLISPRGDVCCDHCRLWFKAEV